MNFRINSITTYNHFNLYVLFKFDYNFNYTMFVFIEPVTLSNPSLIDNKGYRSEKDEATVC